MLGEISSTGDVVYFAGQSCRTRADRRGRYSAPSGERFCPMDTGRNISPGLTRAGAACKSTGEKKRFVVFFSQLGDGPIDDFCVQEVGILVFHRAPRYPGLWRQVVQPDLI